MKEWIKQAQKGSKEAFVALMEQEKLSMIAAARAIVKNDDDVADVLQETVLTAFEKLHTLKEPKYFKTWLMRILINHCCTLLRKRKVIVFSEHFPEEGKTPDWDTAADVQTCLQEIGDSERLILTLFYLQDMSVRDISKVLGVSEDAVKQRLSRARRHFKAIYERGVAVNE